MRAWRAWCRSLLVPVPRASRRNDLGSGASRAPGLEPTPRPQNLWRARGRTLRQLFAREVFANRRIAAETVPQVRRVEGAGRVPAQSTRQRWPVELVLLVPQLGQPQIPPPAEGGGVTDEYRRSNRGIAYRTSCAPAEKPRVTTVVDALVGGEARLVEQRAPSRLVGRPSASAGRSSARQRGQRPRVLTTLRLSGRERCGCVQ